MHLPESEVFLHCSLVRLHTNETGSFNTGFHKDRHNIETICTNKVVLQCRWSHKKQVHFTWSIVIMEQDLIMENIMSTVWSNWFLWSSTSIQKAGHCFGTAWSRWHVLWLGIAAVAERSLTSYQHDDFVDSLNHTHADFSISQREKEAVACLLVNPHISEVNLKTCFPRTLDLNAVVTKYPNYFGSYIVSPLDGGKSQTHFPLFAWWRTSDLFSTWVEAIIAYIAYISSHLDFSIHP